jgi:acyl-CoA thioester hydrolase
MSGAGSTSKPHGRHGSEPSWVISLVGGIKCFAELGLGQIEQSDDVGPILHSASCRFRIPLTYPDTVTVGACIGDVGEDRFVMLYRAVSHRYDAVAADGESLIVTFDYATSTKARVPDDLRARLLEL